MPLDQLLALGAEEDPAKFNMAHMGLRLGQRANGVSQLHGQVSRDMFGDLWPGFDADEVPISSITNGVHAPTWIARELVEMGTQTSSQGELVDGRRPGALRRRRRRSPAGDLWNIRRTLRGRLVEEVRRRLRETALSRGATEAELGWTDTAFDPDVLTDRLRPPRAVLQAAHPDAARPGAAARRCCSTPSGRCSSSSPARATPPTTAASS